MTSEQRNWADDLICEFEALAKAGRAAGRAVASLTPERRVIEHYGITEADVRYVDWITSEVRLWNGRVIHV